MRVVLFSWKEKGRESICLPKISGLHDIVVVVDGRLRVLRGVNIINLFGFRFIPVKNQDDGEKTVCIAVM